MRNCKRLLIEYYDRLELPYSGPITKWIVEDRLALGVAGEASEDTVSEDLATSEPLSHHVPSSNLVPLAVALDDGAFGEDEIAAKGVKPNGEEGGGVKGDVAKTSRERRYANGRGEK